MRPALPDPVANPPRIADQANPAMTSEALKYVYVVKQETIIRPSLPILTERDQVIAIYATPEDACMTILKMATQRIRLDIIFEGYDAVHDDEYLSCSIFEPGSGENGIYLYVEKMEVQPPGSQLSEV